MGEAKETVETMLSWFLSGRSSTPNYGIVDIQGLLSFFIEYFVSVSDNLELYA